MPQSFGDQLKLFALSIDVVDNDRFNSIGEMINSYCKQVLHIQHTRVFLEGTVEGQPGLDRYRLGRKERDSSRRIKNDHGEYNGQSCFAFNKAVPMWIVNKSKKTLSENQDYVDIWNKIENIPSYRQIQDYLSEDNTTMKTSIIVPVKCRHQMLGVVNFETTEYLDIASGAKNELLKIAETICILRSLLSNSRVQKHNTDTAMRQLQENLNKPQPKLTKAKVFLASSARAKSDVIQLIRSVLTNYNDSIDLEYWKENQKPGNINEQLINSIASCRYGLCYFSEAHEEDGHHFRDNPNVLFEAGMFHGRADEMASAPNSWVPIREYDSPPIPFDFAQERIIWVHRDAQGNLNEEKFTKELNQSLLDLILSER
jgi:hypothetical protein